MSSIPRQAAALVQQGLTAQQRGETAAATAHYTQALQLQPGQPDALQLLGLLARRQGDLARAEALMRASLTSREAQPHVWNNLGNVLRAAGRAAEAEACYARAVALQPGYGDSLYNLAHLHHTQGRQPDAAALLTRAMAQSGGATPAMLQLQAQIDADAGRFDIALTTLDRAVALAPERAALHHNRAVLLQRRQRPREALAAHERALTLGADAPDAHYNHGNTLQSLGRLDEAAAAYRRTLARQPAHTLALYDLARLRWRRGEPDFDAELRQARQAHPASPVLALTHGGLLWRAERCADAASAFEAGLQHAPDAAAASVLPALLDGLGRCQVRLGQVDAGLTLLKRAAALAPHDVEVRSNLASCLLEAGRTDVALATAEAACALAPLHQRAQALRGLAARLLGQTAVADWHGVEGLVKVLDLPPPPGWPDMARFNAALAEELHTLHADHAAPIDQTLRGGTQTLGDILDQGHPLVTALRRRLCEAIDSYIAGLPEDARHPVLSRRRSAWRFADSWSSRLRRQGFHTDHVHPHGWISSAYYVAVPPGCADPVQRPGWLRFGRPDLPLAGVDPDSLVQLEVQPKPGRLALFPSMFWHGTRPFDDEAERLTIAFDVLPE